MSGRSVDTERFSALHHAAANVVDEQVRWAATLGWGSMIETVCPVKLSRPGILGSENPYERAPIRLARTRGGGAVGFLTQAGHRQARRHAGGSFRRLVPAASYASLWFLDWRCEAPRIDSIGTATERANDAAHQEQSRDPG